MASHDEWGTPKHILDAIGPIHTDPCTTSDNPTNAKVFYTKADDGLVQPWPSEGLLYCNPPYSDPAPWVQRLIRHNGAWLALLPASTDTKWFHDLDLYAHCRFLFLRGRLRFRDMSGEGKNYGARSPSVLVMDGTIPPSRWTLNVWTLPGVLLVQPT